MSEIPGFDRALAAQNYENLTGAKKNKKSIGFQTMGLSFNVLKGITKRGYKVPTPIQRKVIRKILFLLIIDNKSCFCIPYYIFTSVIFKNKAT